MSSEISLRMALLDQEIVDSDGRPIGRVDDLELELPDDGAPPVVVGLLVGAQALAERLGGADSPAARTARWLRGYDAAARPPTIPAEEVIETGSLVRLRVPLRDLAHVAGLERWLSRHFVERLPGTGHASE